MKQPLNDPPVPHPIYMMNQDVKSRILREALCLKSYTTVYFYRFGSASIISRPGHPFEIIDNTEKEGRAQNLHRLFSFKNGVYYQLIHELFYFSNLRITLNCEAMNL